MLLSMHYFRTNCGDCRQKINLLWYKWALYALLAFVTGCGCMYSCFYRSKMRHQYTLEESPCGDCLVHFCCELCALCQEHRELRIRGFDMSLDCCSSGWLEGPNKVYIPFLACGDLSGYDSDRSYPLPKGTDGTYQSLDPVQPPIAPPYKRALEMKKASNQGMRDLEKLSLDS